MKKVALITGGAHPMGIGFASAKALVRDGFEVTVTGISKDEISLTPGTDGISTVVLDVRDEAVVKDLVGSFKKLDAVVNCAGTGGPKEWEIENFNRTLDINTTGTMRVCMAALPLLEKSKGAIVNIGSMYSFFGSAGTPGYAASKGAVVQLTKSLAAAWGKKGIRVNAIAPGWIKTGLARPLWDNEEIEQRIAKRTPMGRWGEADECGDVIAFLCSPAARFVTGVLIPVDGGYVVSG